MFESLEDAEQLDCKQIYWFGRIEKHECSRFELTTVDLDRNLLLFLETR